MSSSLSEYSEIAPGILSIDVMSTEGCQEIIDISENKDNWTQAEITNYGDSDLLEQYVDLEARNVQVKGATAIPKQCQMYQQVLETTGLQVIHKHWDLSNLEITGLQLAKYETGSHIKAHKDTATEFSRRCVTALLYLNTDYSGGEVVFPRLGCSCKPKSGELILFPSEYLHSVHPVTEGKRYCFVAFFLALSFGNWVEILHNNAINTDS